MSDSVDRAATEARFWHPEVLASIRADVTDGVGLSPTDANALLSGHDELLQQLHEARELLRDLIDPDVCWFDHHGHCQAHGWTAEAPCPHARAKEFLA